MSTVTARTPRPLPDAGGTVERVPWALLGPEMMRNWGYPHGRFNPQALTVYGPSGSGKTYFVGYVLNQRARARASRTVAVVTKRDDATVTAMGWKIVDRWPPNYGDNQVIYWAKAKGISQEHLDPQREKVKALMDALWQPKSNTVIYWDELPYLENDLRLRRELATFYREGRANGITNVASMQRPSGVSRLAHSEAGWTVAFKPKDQDDRKRVAEVFGDRRRFMAELAGLNRAKHEFLIRDEMSGETYISSLPKPARRSRRTSTRPDDRGVRSTQH